MRNGNHRVFGMLVLGTLAACSSSDGDSAEVEGLNTPTQLSIVTASGESEGTNGAVSAGAGAADFPAASDYNTDTADVWVYDPSVEPISMVNEILCMIGQTRAGRMINQGPYIAQINTTRCEQGSGGGGDDGNQSSGSSAEFEFWTVESERASNSAPQQVSVWVPNEEEGQSQTIYVDADVRQGVSAANPFGVFSLDFAAAPSFDDIATPIFTGRLSSLDAASDGFVGFTFFQDFGLETATETIDETTAVNVRMTPDQESGIARVFRSLDVDAGVHGSFSEENDFAVAFDDERLLRADGDDDAVCLSRDSFDTKVWRYNLYHADGADLGSRVELTSGFGFRTEGGDYGWMGYYGMWVPEGAELQSGDTIVEDVWGDEDPAEYTLFQAPGRLIRFTRESVALADIAGQSFQWWTWDGETQMGVEYRVSFDGTVWTKTAQRDEETGEWETIDPPVALTLQNGEWLGLWSQSLGGHVDYLHGDACGCVTVYKEEFVTPGDELFTDASEVTLYGYSEMLASNITEQQAETGNIFLDEVTDVGAPLSFRFDATDMSLYDSGEDAVGLADGVQPDQGPNTWGMRSGPMVLDTSALQTTFDVFNQETYYVWETGHNEWNRYTAALDENDDVVAFDPPVQFSYKHTTAKDRNGDETYDDQVFFLSYEGSGNLGGIPYEGIDTDGDSEPDRWYPLFSLRDGVAMGPTGEEYVVKAIEMEQTLEALALAECDDLDLSATDDLTLPDGSAFSTPTIGEKPIVEDAPAVVEGKVQNLDL